MKLDGEEHSKSQANTKAKLSRTGWYFLGILMHLDQIYWKICLRRRLGGSKSQKMLPRPGAASKIEDREVSRLPQGSWKLSPDRPKRGHGEANYHPHSHFKGQIHSKSLRNCSEFAPTGWKCEICEISKIIEKTMVFRWFSMIFGGHEHGKSKKARYFGILSSLGLIFNANFVENAKTICKIAKWGGPEAPKGWPGMPKRRKKSLTFRQVH